MSTTAMPRIYRTASPRIWLEAGYKMPAPQAGRYLPKPQSGARLPKPQSGGRLPAPRCERRRRGDAR